MDDRRTTSGPRGRPISPRQTEFYGHLSRVETDVEREWDGAGGELVVAEAPVRTVSVPCRTLAPDGRVSSERAEPNFELRVLASRTAAATTP